MLMDLVRPPVKPIGTTIKPRFNEEALAEYKKLAESVGITPPGVFKSEFERFLSQIDWPVFNLNEVIRYMDRIARRDSPYRMGWHWAALRTHDRRLLGSVSFGTASHATDAGRVRRRASNFWHSSDRYGALYDKPIPQHALAKIATIHTNPALRDRVAFLVSDFTVKPHEILRSVAADPFLMALTVDSSETVTGKFVIDVWDEPGFGLESQLK